MGGGGGGSAAARSLPRNGSLQRSNSLLKMAMEDANVGIATASDRLKSKKSFKIV
jgi:hypothetical protein